METVFCDRRVGPVCRRLLGLVFRLGVRVGVAVPLGLDALSLRYVAILPRIRLGLEATDWSLGTIQAHPKTCHSAAGCFFTSSPAETSRARIEATTGRAGEPEAACHIGHQLCFHTGHPPGFRRFGRTSRCSGKPEPSGWEPGSARCEKHRRQLANGSHRNPGSAQSRIHGAIGTSCVQPNRREQPFQFAELQPLEHRVT